MYLKQGRIRRKMRVPEEEYYIPLGKSGYCEEGNDVTIVALSAMVNKVLKVISDNDTGADVELIDPMTLYPMDKETIIMIGIKLAA